MNEVSIIINGVRYDAVVTNSNNPCEECDLKMGCSELLVYACDVFVAETVVFKKSTKSFEP